MRTIKATKTMKYAGLKPHLSLIKLVEGETYTTADVPVHVIESALENDFAEVVESESGPEIETKVIKPESKEKGMKGKKVNKRG